MRAASSAASSVGVIGVDGKLASESSSINLGSRSLRRAPRREARVKLNRIERVLAHCSPLLSRLRKRNEEPHSENDSVFVVADQLSD